MDIDRGWVVASTRLFFVMVRGTPGTKPLPRPTVFRSIRKKGTGSGIGFGTGSGPGDGKEDPVRIETGAEPPWCEGRQLSPPQFCKNYKIGLKIL